MARSTWWIGLAENWEVIQRTSWKEPRPAINPDVHMWIKKNETDELISTPNKKGAMVYDYSIWNSSFGKREFFPIQEWSIVGISTPSTWKLRKNIYIHLEDPYRVVRGVLSESDNNWALKKAFTKIDYKIAVFDSWEEYERQKS
ncbi:hypothetical protein OAK19_02845 [Aureispira]|nr:hypothetical protein [Aureispira sp.]